MTEDIDVAVRQEAWRVVHDDLPVNEFEEWFAGITWDHRSALVADVELLLAERDDRPGTEFRELLIGIVSMVRMGDHNPALAASNAVVNGEFSGRTVTVMHRHAAFAPA